MKAFIFKAIFSLVFVCAGVGLVMWGQNVVAKSKASVDWPTVQGKVRSAEVLRETKRDTSSSTRRESTTYRPDIVYDYEVNGTPYSGNRVGVLHVGSSNPRKAEDVVARYPVGSEVTVFYDPSDPQTAVLEPGVSWFSYMPIVGGTVFVLAGILMLVTAFTGGAQE
jgi:hypothetical protein